MIYVKDIINICHGELISGNDYTLCENFTNDTRKLNKGDVITPIFPGIFLNLDYNLELTTVESNKSIKINDSLTIENTPLKDGQYAYLFQFTDWQGTNIGSRAFIIEFEDGKIE